MVLKDFIIEKEYGVMVVNLFYGECLGEEESVCCLYKEMGYVFCLLIIWSKYILMSDFVFEEYYGVKVIKKWKFYNGVLWIDLF